MSQPKVYTLKEAFDLESAATISGFDDHPFAPAIDKDYVFNTDTMRDILVFLQGGYTSSCMLGPAGAGKTSIVEQFHARLRRPLIVVTGSSDMLTDKLFGQNIINSDGSFAYKYAGILLAMKEGYSCLIDEFNLIPSGIRSSLNRILEGSFYDCPETGERIWPKEGFRVFTTGNPSDRSRYRSREAIDTAESERYFWINTTFPSEECEIKIVLRKLNFVSDEAVKKTIAKALVKSAREVRKIHIDTPGNEDLPDALNVTISTRTLVRWAKAVGLYNGMRQKGTNPFHLALFKVLTGNPDIDPAERKAIHELVATATGEQADGLQI